MFSSKKKHLLHKLYNRELWGQFERGIPSNYEPAKQLFSAVPPRLIYPLSKTIPNIRNHILMGATKCGKFLLTYTFFLDSVNELSPCYRYRLHFWSFIPGKQATKVAEVQLFDNSEVPEILTIVIVQWPSVPNKLVIFGHNSSEVEECEDAGGEESYKVYVTVTTTPSSGCKDCRTVAASFDEEEMAANWNSCVGLTCGRHGLTFHTWFPIDAQSHFDPKISCASDSRIVVSTGSFIHVVEFNTCEPCSEASTAPYPPHVDTPLPAPETTDTTQPQPIRIVNSPIVNRLSYKFLKDSSYMIFVTDSWVNKIITLLIRWLNLGNQIEIKELPSYLKIAIQRHYELTLASKKSSVLNAGNVLESLYSRYLTQKPKWFNSDKTNRLTSSFAIRKRPKEEPDKVYDFEEERVESCTKFKAFRRHCLANKLYEFRSDEDGNVENIRPGARLKHRITRRQMSMMNDEACSEEGDVARFIGGLSRESKYRRRKMKPITRSQNSNSSVDTSSFEFSDEVHKVMSQGFGHQSVTRSSMRHKRTYIESDREILSTVTEIDDEECGLGFPCHLPMSVHGAAYAQMQRIYNRTERLNVWSAEVIQSSLDIEGICHMAAENVCHAENFEFNYFVDYDIEIIQVCPTTGDILIILFIRLCAEKIKHKESNLKTDSGGRHRNYYDCQILVIWSPESKICYLEGYTCLAEVSNARNNVRASVEANRLRHIIKTTFGFGVPNYRNLIHQASGEQLMSCSLIIDHDNLIGFKKTSQSTSSTTLHTLSV